MDHVGPSHYVSPTTMPNKQTQTVLLPQNVIVSNSNKQSKDTHKPGPPHTLCTTTIGPRKFMEWYSCTNGEYDALHPPGIALFAAAAAITMRKPL